MNVTEAIKLIDQELFAKAGRPAFYSEARPTEYTDRGMIVVYGGPPEGLAPHACIVLHFSKDREVQWVGVCREGADFKKAGFAGEERMLSLGYAIIRCLEILEAERQKHPVGAGWSRERPLRVLVDDNAVHVPHCVATAKEARAALGVPPGMAVRFAGELLEFTDGWSFAEGEEFAIEGFAYLENTTDVTLDDSIGITDQLDPWQSDPESWKDDQDWTDAEDSLGSV